MISELGLISISLLAIILLLVAAIAVLQRESVFPSFILFAALTLTAVLELVELCSLTLHGYSLIWKKYSFVVESLLPFVWLFASLTYARQAGPWRIGRLLKSAIAFTSLLFLLPLFFSLGELSYTPELPHAQILYLNSTGYFFYIFIMVIIVWAMVNFEMTLINASDEGRWRIKFNIIGLNTILFVQFIYFSQALIYRKINMLYVTPRTFILIIGACMVLYSLFFRHEKIHIQVSRQAAFKSIILIVIAVYLIIIGLMGESLKYLATPFQYSPSMVFVFLVAITLVLSLFTNKFRREIKISLHKNIYQNKHDYRTQWLRFTEMLATAKTLDELQQRILSAYCDIFGIGGANLFLYEEGRGGYCTTANYRMDPIVEVISTDNSLIKFMKDHNWIINIRDGNTEIFTENGYFFGENSIFLVVPLFDGDNLEGFIALGKSIHSSETYIYEDYDLMKTIARQASLAIMHQKLSEQVTKAREVEAIGNVAAFVVHDLKNLVSNLSLIVQNAAKYVHNPDFQKDMICSLDNTVNKMQMLIGRLKNLGEKRSLKLSTIDLLELAHDTARQIGGGRVEVSGLSEKVYVDREEIQKVILNLLINAIEASEPDEGVRVEVGFIDCPFFRVTDYGNGMPVDFIRKNLFKPFSSTKKQGLGIGLYQCRQIIEAHSGKIEVNSEEGKGTVFTVSLPENL